MRGEKIRGQRKIGGEQRGDKALMPLATNPLSGGNCDISKSPCRVVTAHPFQDTL